MICHICKDKVASIRLKEIINDIVTDLHLCQACFEARETQGVGAPDKGLVGGTPIEAFGKKRGEESLKCPGCGTTVDDFRDRGRLGCADCYSSLARALEPVLVRVHGATEHRGKIPHPATRKLDLKNELRHLQADLHDAIVSENYERAAKLRDKIKKYESM